MGRGAIRIIQDILLLKRLAKDGGIVKFCGLGHREGRIEDGNRGRIRDGV